MENHVMASGATNIIPQISLEILYAIANGNRFQKVQKKKFSPKISEMFFPLFIGYFKYIFLFQKIVIIIFFNIVFLNLLPSKVFTCNKSVCQEF
jgi:hypothetical protein